jgi:hypothetical protein
MIVWAGDTGFSSLNSGGRYDPAVNAWTATSTTAAPSARVSHTAVWTGHEMIVWGGMGGGLQNTGGRYDPAMDSWTATSATGAPSRRFNHTAVWTGGSMIVWGGFGGSALDTGGVYTLTSTLSLSPTSQSFTASGGSGSVSVTAPASCTWTAVSQADWLSITSGSSGTGDGTVNTHVSKNPLAKRQLVETPRSAARTSPDFSQ